MYNNFRGRIANHTFEGLKIIYLRQNVNAKESTKPELTEFMLYMLNKHIRRGNTLNILITAQKRRVT